MIAAIHHRGPDDDGLHLDAGVALGMRRLSIIDIEGSAQPLANRDGTVTTVFNGEIYNFRSLRDDLRRRGHEFATAGDTEVIVHLYEEHGTRFASHLSGMFAVAVWDAPRRRLVLARDHMGIKPLYLHEGPGGLAFASEVKSLIAGGIVAPALDPLAAELFMAHGYVPGPRTLFAGVRKLTPGSVLVWEDGTLASEGSYWSPFDAAPRATGSWDDDRDALLELLDRSVQEQMVSDVPLGVMLSGGLDSSLIAALMARSASGPVKTFSIGFAEDGAANELDDARRVARRLGTDHHELLTSAVDHPELLDDALWHLEEPVADISFLGFTLLSRLAREWVTVALSGQGADELLGGYRKHQIAALAGVVQRGPGSLRATIETLAGLAPRGSTAARGLRSLATGGAADRLLAMSRVVQPHQRLELFEPDYLQPGAEDEIIGSVTQHLEGRELSALAETLFLDTRLALVDNMLLYFDKTSMAASLEVRVPFLAPDLVSFCTGLPDPRRVWRLRRKELLKRASRGLVDDAIIDKPKRGFFHAALGAWLRAHRDDLFSSVLLDPRALGRGQFREASVRALLDQAGQAGKKSDQRLLCLLLLEKWQRLFVDPDGRAAEIAPPSGSVLRAPPRALSA
jgi:asparagine synthase (glutamine-hydrolysing)